MLGSTAAALTSTAASICCIGPVAIAILGVNGAIFAAGLKPYRFYLLALSALMLGFAYWAVYFRKSSRFGGDCSVRSGRLAQVVLWVASGLWIGAVVIQFEILVHVLA